MVITDRTHEKSSEIVCCFWNKLEDVKNLVFKKNHTSVIYVDSRFHLVENTFYYKSKVNRTWDASNEYCSKINSSLVSIKSKKNAEEFLSFLATAGLKTAWIGASNSSDKSTYWHNYMKSDLNDESETATSQRYENSPYERDANQDPALDSNEENCETISYEKDGNWTYSNKHHCRSLKPFICQRP